MEARVRRVAFSAAAAAALWVAGPAPAWSDPTLDPAFGASGFARVGFAAGYSDTPYDMLVQPDGKILTSGITTGAGGYFVGLSRHLPDGRPDSLGFGTAGRVWVHFDLRDQADAIAVQPDGKIVAVGMQNSSSGVSSQLPSVYRFNADGSLDSTFSGDGWFAGRFEPVSCGELTGVTITAEGKILAAGRCNANINGGHHGFGYRRFLPSGDPDPSFGTGGVVLHATTAIGPLSYVRPGVAFLADGGALVATHIYRNGRYEFIAERADSGGAIVPFASGSRLLTGAAASPEVTKIAPLPDGRFVISGTTPRESPPGTQLTVLCFHSDGRPDSSFGVFGRTDVSFTTGTDRCMDLAVDSSGRIVLSGAASNTDAGLVRLLSDGTLDPAFGTGGARALDISAGGGSGYFTGGLVVASGALLVGGWDFTIGSGDFVIARFGYSTTGVGDGPAGARGFALRPAFPNPSRSDVTLAFELPRTCRVALEVFDLAGRCVGRLADGIRGPGRHSATWSPGAAGQPRAGAGLYFARLTAVDDAGRMLCRTADRIVRIP